MTHDLGTIANIWTYPVKSLHRVAHDTIAVVEDGLAGDRRAALYVTTAEHARTGKWYRGKEDERLHTIVDPDTALRAANERGVDLEVHAGERYFDARPVSIVFDRWVEEIERLAGRPLDPQRWRPNFYVRSGADISETDMVGMRIALGESIMNVVAAIRRCVTTTYDVETTVSDPNVLRVTAQDRENILGIYCEVERPGTVRVGDALTVAT